MDYPLLWSWGHLNIFIMEIPGKTAAFIDKITRLDISQLPPNLQYKSHMNRQWNYWSLRCSWSIACRHCSNYIFILDLTPGFNILHKDNCKMRRETFKFGYLVCFIIDTWRKCPIQIKWLARHEVSSKLYMWGFLLNCICIIYFERCKIFEIGHVKILDM